MPRWAVVGEVGEPGGVLISVDDGEWEQIVAVVPSESDVADAHRLIAAANATERMRAALEEIEQSADSFRIRTIAGAALAAIRPAMTPGEIVVAALTEGATG